MNSQIFITFVLHPVGHTLCQQPRSSSYCAVMETTRGISNICQIINHATSWPERRRLRQRQRLPHTSSPTSVIVKCLGLCLCQCLCLLATDKMSYEPRRRGWSIRQKCFTDYDKFLNKSRRLKLSTHDSADCLAISFRHLLLSSLSFCFDSNHRSAAVIVK